MVFFLDLVRKCGPGDSPGCSLFLRFFDPGPQEVLREVPWLTLTSFSLQFNSSAYLSAPFLDNSGMKILPFSARISRTPADDWRKPRQRIYTEHVC